MAGMFKSLFNRVANKMFKSLFNRVANKAEIDWDDLEASLVTADLGIRFAMKTVDDLKGLGRKVSEDDVKDVLIQRMTEILPAKVPELTKQEDGKPTVVMLVGVNGVGKTTSAAKLARLLHQQWNTVTLAAADTFRAAAVDQLERWSERLGIKMVKGAHESDPASVCYKAHEEAIQNGSNYLICDTAGRLHTRHNLMEELSKIKRTLAKQDERAPHLTLLVVDASTGSNALVQAKQFHKACPLDGLIVTKLDGSGKGGIVVPIQEELGIPPYFIGTGEEPDQFEQFERERFLDQLI